MEYTEWAHDLRWWVALCYIVMIGAIVYTYLKLSGNGRGDGYAQRNNRREGQRRIKKGRRWHDGEPSLHTGYGTRPPAAERLPSPDKDRDKPEMGWPHCGCLYICTPCSDKPKILQQETDDEES